ncbi:MAG: diiron oxygenase [Acidimicrobiales bacterium]|nr:diiron oxygenase [Acidimicrobiales bacterium]
MAQATVTRRVEKLNNASSARVVEPDQDLPGKLGDGQLLPDEILLPTVGIDDGILSPEQTVTLSRQALASITTAGLQFEAILIAGFGLQIAGAPDYTDPRVTYLLHEMGEETRHSRLFARMLAQLEPPAPNPIDNWLVDNVANTVIHQIVHNPALLYTMVIAGEEIPDLLQKRAADHPDTDPFVRAVNRYHRQEEARHLAFARMMLPEVWERASVIDKSLVRFLAPTFIREMYENLIHAGVFGAVGLPAVTAWRAARNHPGRVQVRLDATRPVLNALIDAGVLERGKVPTAWRGLCAVDPDGHPVTR